MTALVNIDPTFERRVRDLQAYAADLEELARLLRPRDLGHFHLDAVAAHAASVRDSTMERPRCWIMYSNSGMK